ncbi:hypothetical protein [Alteraurantiacibacter palmitatis]|uniref:Translation initiation factor IF-2 n=1 Tax=Alteraurantiacibacter palmitatis TaxID=2054628 RepID=A0ABV7EBD6_9SPHN
MHALFALVASLALAAPASAQQAANAQSPVTEGKRTTKQPRTAQGNNRGYVVGKGGVARLSADSGAQAGSTDTSHAAPAESVEAAEAPPPPAAGAIGVNEPGVNRAVVPSLPIGVNEPGVNRASRPQ